jgi:hypothetical protein
MGFSGTDWLLIVAGFVAGALLGLCLYGYAADAARAWRAAWWRYRSKATRPKRADAEWASEARNPKSADAKWASEAPHKERVRI